MTSKNAAKRAVASKPRGRTGSILGTRDIVAFVPTRDFDKARPFYADVLGLKFVRDDGFALVFDLNGTMLRIAKVQSYAPAPFTILGWQVTKIEATAASLRERGVKFENFGMPGQSADGIWSAPGGEAKVAWFKDPDGNVLSISEHG